MTNPSELRMTRTYATLPISPAAFAEIEAYFKSLGRDYAHVFMEDESAIDMHGIAITPDPDLQSIAIPFGFVIAHVDGKRWRTLDSQGGPDWAYKIEDALVIGSRVHADAFAADDPEDVRILPRSIATATSEELRAMLLLIELTRTTYLALEDDSVNDELSTDGFKKIANALDGLDTLPDERPGHALGPSGRAAWALRRFLGEPT